MTQGIDEETSQDVVVLLAQILEELRMQGEILRKAAGFLDNPVKRYRQSMKEAKRGGGGDAQRWD